MSNTDVGDGRSESRSTPGSSGSPREIAAGAVETVKQEAASFATDVRDKAADKIEEHKHTATQTLGDFANAIRKAGDELADTDQSMATRLVRQAADGLEGLARSVSDKRPEELLDAVRDFGRRNPTAFIAGSVLAGIALGRFLKSSSAASDSAMNSPATFSPTTGGRPDAGLDQPRSFASSQMAQPTAGATGATAGTTAGFTDPTAAAASSIGATNLELGAQGAMADDLVSGDVGGIPADDLDREDIGDSGVTDADRARFSSGS